MRNSRSFKCPVFTCSKLTIKTPERCKWRCSGVFIVNFEHILHLVLLFILLTLNMQMPTGYHGSNPSKDISGFHSRKASAQFRPVNTFPCIHQFSRKQKGRLGTFLWNGLMLRLRNWILWVKFVTHTCIRLISGSTFKTLSLVCPLVN